MSATVVERWLKRLVWCAALILLGVLTVLVWRLAVLVHRLDGSVEALSADVRTVTREASEVANEIGRFRGRLDEVEDAAVTWMSPAGVVDKLAGGDAVHEKEIAWLLEYIGRPELTYEYGDDKHGAAWVQTKLAVKYRAYRSQIKSAEEFIDKVASTTLDNETYYVVSDGNKRELREFLLEALEKHRALNEPPAEP